MTKTKAETKMKTKPAASVEESIRIRMSDDYKRWLTDAAEHCQTNVAGLVSIAVAQYARSLGFEKKPPRRMSL